MVGRCRLCLTDQSVTLVKLERDETVAEKSLEYSTTLCITRCRKPNSNQTINANKDIRPKARDRSVSVNESSRPASMQKWPTHTGLTRERADSMPSRARTTSECATHLPHPPRLHNNPLGRPPSTSYNRGISYSPPGASSPVSPGSAACSTDSAGSSLSMDSDVTDGHWEDRYSHSLTPDEPVIVEENADDYAPWIARLNSQVSRLEMNSPGGKAKNGSYVIMSPGPFQSGELSTGSSCSVTSGTPSTDQRFRDYPLDKVSSYFNGEEEIVPAERPTRAYSLGSRPTFNKNRTELPVTTNNERTRAFSVGSKNAKGFNLLKMHNHHPHHMSSHSSMEPSDDMMELDFSKKGRMKNRKKPSSSERLSVPGGSASTLSSAASSYSTAEGSYMDMSPRCSPSLAPSPPQDQPILGYAEQVAAQVRFFIIHEKLSPGVRLSIAFSGSGT
ncbi:unnamed protein product [Nesidiocoris tenuis]|uniref:Uncharacterized protein n=1 Tax=Nesidiocoris tenuis TaxID=355587 RepID=A0A6H5H6D5_9HEMI|nr:unnamed protein product [Nesidiocoris tenuis]